VIDKRALVAILVIFICVSIPAAAFVYAKIRKWERAEQAYDLTRRRR